MVLLEPTRAALVVTGLLVVRDAVQLDTRRAGAQKKSTMYGPSGCWRLKCAPASRHLTFDARGCAPASVDRAAGVRARAQVRPQGAP
jgi:hypothetical protein